jgi:hypothetical protein
MELANNSASFIYPKTPVRFERTGVFFCCFAQKTAFKSLREKIFFTTELERTREARKKKSGVYKDFLARVPPASLVLPSSVVKCLIYI